MASSKRNHVNDITTFFLPVSKHESAPNLGKSPVGPLKRDRNYPSDGVVASPSVSADIRPEPPATRSPAVISPAHAATELPAKFHTPPLNSAVKKIKSESREAFQSIGYLKMPSLDSQHMMLLQSAEPTLSDKDYAALRTSSSPSAVASSAMYPACRSPKFDEDEEELADLKLIPGKGRAQEFSEDALMLPKSFMDLEVIFEQMLKILASAHARRKKHTPLDSLKGDMASMYDRSLKEDHLRQITALVPQCLLVGHSWTKDGKSYYRTVSINTAHLNLRPGQEVLHVQCLADMKSSLRESMLSLLRARHSEFLQANHIELAVNPERISQWHADFDLGAVQLPATELPPLPQVQAADSARKSIKDFTVEITPEVEAAFEKHRAETPMPPGMRQFIRDSSKSAIGLQNIEKLRKHELSQFALQQSFKAADEKNAETTFRSAANSLRSYFLQRSTKVLPIADVLKALLLSKGLALTGNLDASNMVDRLVDKLPQFFLRKKYATQGEKVLILSSEPFPWYKSREYPQ